MSKTWQGKQKVVTFGHQEDKMHIKSEMTQTILEKIMSNQHIQHNHHTKNHKQRSSIDMEMKMHKQAIQLCETNCHT